ncbi:hypothetical protein LWI29_030842 [Acer saccharum]|uniref:Uncharacterized protein n=1 Tax=Acer saccharum TaxID=4024 RepID=A0AA39SVG6_ACESA|nr:hypothetical protein LWI29_030842 [Acer saccharum]
MLPKGIGEIRYDHTYVDAETTYRVPPSKQGRRAKKGITSNNCHFSLFKQAINCHSLLVEQAQGLFNQAQVEQAKGLFKQAQGEQARGLLKQAQGEQAQGLFEQARGLFKQVRGEQVFDLPKQAKGLFKQAQGEFKQAQDEQAIVLLFQAQDSKLASLLDDSINGLPFGHRRKSLRNNLRFFSRCFQALWTDSGIAAFAASQMENQSLNQINEFLRV